MDVYEGADNSTRAKTLLRHLIDGHDPQYGAGSMTCSTYDTAWVSMIAKTSNGQTRWLFPSSFQYLLDHQEHDGGWQRNPSDNDGILNSLAALLALCRHITQPRQIGGDLADLKHRKSRAVYFLEAKFSSWTVGSTATDPGFQPLVAKLLQMLQNEGIHFFFPGRDLFHRRRESGKFTPSQSKLHSDPKPPASGDLEGWVGEIDFDRMGQHRIAGSMMASPASTAAYLMNASTWDGEAEAYLTYIVSLGDGQSIGGVPTRFPNTVAEISGAVAILLENGFTHRDLGVRTLGNAATYLEDCLQLESGVTGFTQYIESDADNSAKVISTLCLLGQTPSPQGMIVRYETRDYFKTSTQNSTPSFSTNCHVLKALLYLHPGNNLQTSSIEKAVKFICNCWWTTNGRIEDQANNSANYPIMLMVDALMLLVQFWEKGYISVPNDSAIRNKVFLSLFQALTRTLRAQNADGSWENGGCEVTSYAIISLAKLSSLTCAPKIKLQIEHAIQSGQRFLSKEFRTSNEPDDVWKAKITSGSRVMYQTYALAALKASTYKQWTKLPIESYFEISLAKLTIQTKYHARQPWFVDIPEWLVQACLIETQLFLPQIRDVRYAVFPRDNLIDDRHFQSVPFAWIVANNLDNRSIGAEFIYQMTILSILGRQLEDYMENVVCEAFAGCLFEIEDIVHSIFHQLTMEDKDQCFCDSYDKASDTSSAATSISAVRSVLHRFTSHVLNHPYALMATFQDQAQLRSELMSFLLSRVSQLSGDQGGRSSTDQTPHPYTFAFLACLVGKQDPSGAVGLRRDFLDSPEQQFLAADLCRHMSVISFISNKAEERRASPFQPVPKYSGSISLGNPPDYCSSETSISTSSTSSSSYEASLSPVSPISSESSVAGYSSAESVFQKPSSHTPSLRPINHSQETLQMTRLLSHERRCLNLCHESLIEAGINVSTMNVIKLFVDFHDLSEQIYRDPNIGSTYPTSTAHGTTDNTCTLSPPPVPSKRNRGSVSAARAALIMEPLETKQICQQDSRMQQPLNDNHWTTIPARIDRTVSPTPIERDWSWNKKPLNLARRPSKASSEISRIESIMSEIDGIKLGSESQPTFQAQRRTASESDAWAQCQLEIGIYNRHKNTAAPDVEAIKLAKARVETQRQLSHDNQRRAPKDLGNQSMTETFVQRKPANNMQTKAGQDCSRSEEKRRAICEPDSSGWVKAPPSETAESLDVRARKLSRASRLGGPRWKAPF